MQPEFRVDVHSADRKVVLELTGELDVASSPALEQAIAGARAAETVVVDLRTLEFIDSTGLGVLVRAHHDALARGQEFALVQGQGQVQRLLMITGLADQLQMVETAQELPGGP